MLFHRHEASGFRSKKIMKWLINLLKLFQHSVPSKPEPVQSIKKSEPSVLPQSPVEPIESSKVIPSSGTSPEVFKNMSGDEKASIIPEPPYDESVTYREALRLILKFEGGYVNDPNDPGGETNKGITKKVYDEYRASKNLPLISVKNITDEEVSDIYRTLYWLKGKCDKVGATRLAIVHFDTCVNTGVRQAAKILQRTVEVTDDGIIGPSSLDKVAEKLKKDGDLTIAQKYLEKRRIFYNDLVKQKPSLQKFLKGWLNRVATIEKYIIDRK